MCETLVMSVSVGKYDSHLSPSWKLPISVACGVNCITMTCEKTDHPYLFSFIRTEDPLLHEDLSFSTHEIKVANSFFFWYSISKPFQNKTNKIKFSLKISVYFRNSAWNLSHSIPIKFFFFAFCFSFKYYSILRYQLYLVMICWIELKFYEESPYVLLYLMLEF